MTNSNFEEILIKLKHHEWEQRFLAAKKLSSPTGRLLFDSFSRAQQVEITKILISFLEDSNPQVRMQSAETLGALNCREAVDALVTALADPHDWVRVQVAAALGKVGNPFIARLLAQHLETENEQHVRATLVKSIGLIGDETVAPILMVYLDDEDSRVRANCVEALTQLKISKANLREAILKLTNDPSNRVRANVAMCLISLGEDKGREILGEMVKSKDEFMRASAAYAYGEIGTVEDRTEMINLLGDPSWMVRKNAVRALCKHGVKVLPELLKALNSNDQMIRIGALEVLASLKVPSTRISIIPLLEDESGEVRSKAEEVLDIIDGF